MVEKINRWKREDVGVQTERGGGRKKRKKRKKGDGMRECRAGGRMERWREKRGVESMMNSSKGALGFLISSRL